MDAFFPNQGWIRLDRDVLAALAKYKAVHGLISWEAQSRVCSPGRVTRYRERRPQPGTRRRRRCPL